MTYKQALAYIHSRRQFGSRPGLEAIGELLRLMGDPQDGLRYVHVAGTSGKGSTSTAIASVLQEAGYRTGLYVSPYVEDFCERIQVNGVNIPPERLAAEVEAVMPMVDKVAAACREPTEFEVITALAFDYFKSCGCDVVVLEVGLGGRLDATNIINRPLISVVTPISYDHVDVLGDTLEKIAFEKCGIIKDGGVTVSSPAQPGQALSVIMETCARRGNTLLIPNINAVRILREGIEGTAAAYGPHELWIPLCGRHQVTNFITAVEALTALRDRFGFHISDENLVKGLGQVKCPARIEVAGKRPLVIVDAAHNQAKLAALADAIRRFIKPKRLAVVMGILADKDYEASISLIARLAGRFIAVKPQSLRALSAETTAEVARRCCGDVVIGQDYRAAFLQALSYAGDDGAVVVTGSFYLAGPMRGIVREELKNDKTTHSMPTK